MSHRTNKSVSSIKNDSRNNDEPRRNKNKLFAYQVPKEIYEKALQEIYAEDPLNRSENMNLQFCHHQSNQHFNCTEDPNSKGNLMEGAKQALEDRNFGTLYEIINKALEMKLPTLLQQLQEYMYIAISHDPLIEDKKKVMQDFLLRVKLVKDEARCEEYLRKAHSFGKLETEEPMVEEDQRPDEEFDSSQDFDNVSEASLELKMFEAIKNELPET